MIGEIYQTEWSQTRLSSFSGENFPFGKGGARCVGSAIRVNGGLSGKFVFSVKAAGRREGLGWLTACL